MEKRSTGAGGKMKWEEEDDVMEGPRHCVLSIFIIKWAGEGATAHRADVAAHVPHSPRTHRKRGMGIEEAARLVYGVIHNPW